MPISRLLRFALVFALALVGAVPAPLPAQGLPAQEPQAQAPSVPEGMVLVQAGSFLMGSDGINRGFLNSGDASPQHSVTLPAFYIDKTEVTNAEYKKYCDATGYPPPPHWIKGSYADGQASVPVTHVNWWEAVAYARWAGKRLPTEAEWEKAARGTDSRVYPWGNNWDETLLPFNAEAPHAVGQYPKAASPYGALDMAGNVFEWTADWYQAYPGTAHPMPQYGKRYKVIRGGGFDGSSKDATTTHRSVLPPGSRSQWTGFRCVKEVEQPK